ncbi:MAG: nucleoside phosphorylase [Acidobacteriaceae bacterium]|nr:nucleoside phosphorylase [Acidobacteriaceae bacterium]
MTQPTENTRKASTPWKDDRPPHLPCKRGELPAAVLFPGDPGRVDRFATLLDGFRIVGQNREYRIGVGKYRGVELGVCSTGIGGPSTEIAMVEAAGLGCRYALRVGGTGALRAEIPLGALLVVNKALRGGGAASFYAAGDIAATADPAILAALQFAASQRGVEPIRATVASTDSYYLAQGRPVAQIASDPEALLAQYRERGADALDMEAETVLVVGKAVGMHAGALLAVHANRATDGWLEDFGPAQNTMLSVGCEALVQLLLAEGL